jgi:uncharacterized protein YaeQ
MMALSSTIYKAELNIADMDNHNYSAHSLTLARHPSETEERLMVRLLAFALFASESLTFGKGLSEDDAPDLIQKDLTDAIELWIDVGLPTEKDIKKACGKSNQVAVFLYGGNIADMWWKQNSKVLLKLKNLTVYNLPDTMQLVDLCVRNMDISCNTQDGQLSITSPEGSIEMSPLLLKDFG